MLLAPTGKNNEMIRRLIERGMHIVFIDRKPDSINAPSVLSENEEGAYQATSHLISLGHRRIGIVVGLPTVSTTVERLHGYEQALSEAGLPLDKGLITYGGSQIDGAERACKELFDLPDRPTAVFAGNNLMTIGVMKQLRKLGIRCPQDVSVIGFDDFEWATCFEPTLTMVAQDPYRIGFTAVEQLFEDLSGKRVGSTDTRIPTQLKVRGSTSSLEDSTRG
jgi:LacI family transcriptional regulator